MSLKIRKTVELEVEFPFVGESLQTGAIYLVAGYDEASRPNPTVDYSDYVEIIRLKTGYASSVPAGVMPAANLQPIEEFTIKTRFKMI